MRAGPSELGKLARKLWKLGKDKTYKKYLKQKQFQSKCAVHIVFKKIVCMAQFFVFTTENSDFSCMYRIVTLELFRISNWEFFYQQVGKKILFCFGNGALF